MNYLKKDRNASPDVANEVDTFRTSVPGAFAKRHDRKVPDYINVSDQLASVGTRLSGGVIEIDLPTGDYVYRGLAMLIQGKQTTAITSYDAATLMDKFEDDEYYVQAKYFFNLISRVTLEADGLTIWDFENWNRFVNFQRIFGWDGEDTDPGEFVGFGWPHVFREGSPIEDLYALGTLNIRDLKLKVYTKDVWQSEMQLKVPVWYNPVSTTAAHVISRQVYRTSIATAGRHVIDDIRIDKRIWRVVITTNQGKKVKSFRAKVGDVVWQEAATPVNMIQMLKLSKARGGTQAVVGPYRSDEGKVFSGYGSVIDLMVDFPREALSIKPLTSSAQRRRDDRFSVELDLVSAGTEVTIEVYFADRI